MPTRYLNEAEKRVGRKHLLWYEIYNGIASTFLGDTLVVLLEEAVRQQTLADDVAHRHARVQAGIRILEDELQVTADLVKGG